MRASYIVCFLSLIFLVQTAHAYYEVKCDFFTNPQKYKEAVTIDSVGSVIKFTNIGDMEFPATQVNVSILTPDGRILEPYYSFWFNLRTLSINESFIYKRPFTYKNETSFSNFYETPIPGTWEIRVKLIKLPLDNLTYTHSNLIRTNGECRYYFSVKEFAQYENEQKDSAIQEKIINMTADLKNLTILLVFLGIISITQLLYNFGKKLRPLIMFYALMLLAIYIPQIVVFPLGDIVRILLFGSSIWIFYKFGNEEPQYGINKKLYSLYLLIVLISSIWLLTKSISIFELDYFSSAIGLVAAFIGIFASASYFIDISNKFTYSFKKQK